MKKIVNSDQAPQAIGPYSQAVSANGFLFVSGQIPLEPQSGQVVYGGIEAQTHQVFANLKAILAKENLTLNNVIKTTVFLKNMEQFAAMNTIYGQYFTQEYPARICVEVSRMPKDVEVEIDAIAVYNN